MFLINKIFKNLKWLDKNITIKNNFNIKHKFNILQENHKENLWYKLQKIAINKIKNNFLEIQLKEKIILKDYLTI